MVTLLLSVAVLQTRLTHLNFDSRGVTDACLPLLLPLGPCLRELDLSGGRITSQGAAVLAACFRGLQVLDLCGGHITGELRSMWVGVVVGMGELHAAVLYCGRGESGSKKHSTHNGPRRQGLVLRVQYESEFGW